MKQPFSWILISFSIFLILSSQYLFNGDRMILDLKYDVGQHVIPLEQRSLLKEKDREAGGGGSGGGSGGGCVVVAEGARNGGVVSETDEGTKSEDM